MMECECEHAAHFPEDKKLTLNGNPGHKYGAKFSPDYIVPVKTPYGIFRVCKDCANDCYQHFPVNYAG